MVSFSNSYPIIPTLDKFREILEERGKILLQETEAEYCNKIHSCLSLDMSPRRVLLECNQLLSGDFNKFVDLMEALYEVRYYWKRLSEVARILEVSAPTTLPQILESSWFIYNLDYYWHSVYGLEERIIKFLLRFKRMYKSPSDEEEKLLESWINAYKHIKTQGTKKIRDPLAHMRSQGVQGWRDDHQWEASLVRDDRIDFIEAYDTNFLEHKKYYLDNVRAWVNQHFEAFSIMFDKLCGFSSNKLEKS